MNAVLLLMRSGRIFRLRLFIARTEDERETGLQHQTSMQADQGMLFVLPKTQIVDFHNNATLLPLDLTFLDAKGVVIATTPMKTIDESDGEVIVYRSAKPFRYALETLRGVLSGAGIQPGDRLLITENL